MFIRRDRRAFIRLLLILLALTGATDAAALLIVPTGLNGNEVFPALSSAPNEIGFAVAFHELRSAQFDVLFESNDDPFSPVALMGLIENLTVVSWSGLTMTLGGGATLTEIGDATLPGLVSAFSRDTVAEFTFDSPFGPGANGMFGVSQRWLINTHGARVLTINLAPTSLAQGAQIPEPAPLALVLIALMAMRTRKRSAAIRTH